MSRNLSITIEPADPFDLSVDDLPGSRSQTNRALLFGALAEGTTQILGALFADDSHTMIVALRTLGFSLETDSTKRTISIMGCGGSIPVEKANLNLQNAGTAMRLLTAAVCLGRGTYTLDGSPRMRERPIGGLVSPLNRIGGDIQYMVERGFPPLQVSARGLVGGSVLLDRPISSQFISALLAAGPAMHNGIEITCKGHIPSPAYIRMTASMMEQFGVRIDMSRQRDWFSVAPGKYHACDYEVEPDASSAGYLFSAAAIVPGARCMVHGLGHRSIQGDALFVKVLEKMGAEVSITKDAITVIGPDKLHGLDVDLSDMPDSAQTLAVVALFAEGPTIIRKIGNLRVKETDRLAALEKELKKLGAKVVVAGHDMKVEMAKTGAVQPARIETYGDHRMAMSFALAGLRAAGIEIEDPNCVSKTFPEYWRYLDRLRASSR